MRISPWTCRAKELPQPGFDKKGKANRCRSNFF